MTGLPRTAVTCATIAVLVAASCSEDAANAPVKDAAGDDDSGATDGGSDDVSTVDIGSEQADAVDLADAATPEGCPGKPGCPCQTDLDCDDQDACTVDDRCIGGYCGFPAPANCDDANSCTADSCLPAQGCTSTDASGLPCVDGNPCTLEDSCLDGACHGGAPRNCDDGNKCTDDACIPDLGCTFAHNKKQCRDANACIEAAFCAFASCPGSKVKPCNDGNACTYDTCTPETGCESVAMPSPTTACDGTARWGRCFKALKKKATWRQARAACRAWGGELASVRDKYDNAFIRELADKACGKEGAWIGLTDVAREWTWRWSDATFYGFRAWNKGEPNNANDEDYTEIVSSGGWNDLGAKHQRNCMVCARPMRVACNDGNQCTAADVCDLAAAATSASSGVPLAICATGTEATDCDDHTPCTLDSCTPKKGCAHKPVKDKTSCGDGDCEKGTCFWSVKKVFASCKDALAKNSKLPSGVYTLLGTDASGQALTYKAWCDMAGEHGGGWTMALQSSGTKSTLAWASKLWSNKETLQADKAPWKGQEAKLASYWSVPGDEALVVMSRNGVKRALRLPLATKVAGLVVARSLHEVIAAGKHVKSNLDFKQWKALIPGSSLQFHCHAQGFNAFVKGAGRARIGIIGNNENNCASPDSWLGVGGHEKMCGNKTVKSTGNVACITTDNGNRRLPTFAWVMVR